MRRTCSVPDILDAHLAVETMVYDRNGAIEAEQRRPEPMGSRVFPSEAVQLDKE